MDDETSLAQRPRQRWLKHGPTRRRRVNPATTTTARRPLRREPSRSNRATCTAETVNLARTAATKSTHGSEARATGPHARGPKPKARPAPRRTGPHAAPAALPASAAAATSSDDLFLPMSLDSAVDTWMLTLGMRHIDEEVGNHFLPEATMSSIGDTFLDHGIQDRQVLMLAVHRVALNLLASMGEAIRVAAQQERDDQARERGEDTDESVYMQMPSSFQTLLQQLLHDLEEVGKASSPCMAEWLIDWLSHRCANSAGGYWIGHSQGYAAEVLAVLATFVGDANADTWGQCNEEETQWATAWAHRLQLYLPVHEGSRQAHRLPPERSPVMLFSKPMPDSSEEEAVGDQSVHGDLPARVIDHLVEAARTEDSPPGPLQPEPSPHDAAELQYLQGLRTPEASEPPSKVRVMMLEVSSGSTDTPKRTIRVPLDANGTANLRLRIWQEDELDQDGIATQLVAPRDMAPADKPAVSEIADTVPDLEHANLQGDRNAWGGDIDAISLDVVRSIAANSDLNEDQIERLYGVQVLHMVQTCRALQDFEDSPEVTVHVDAGSRPKPVDSEGVAVADGENLLEPPTRVEHGD
ncbi:unnamed protein product [Symbiodinium sp. CCMP2592]|nr:unnamed protein product [Symbiodinium sp. CCMP2592]